MHFFQILKTADSDVTYIPNYFHGCVHGSLTDRYSGIDHKIYKSKILKFKLLYVFVIYYVHVYGIYPGHPYL